MLAGDLKKTRIQTAMKGYYMNTAMYTELNPETEDLKKLISSKIEYYNRLPEDAKNRRYLAREIQLLQRCYDLLLATNLAYSIMEADVCKTVKTVTENPNARHFEGILFFYSMQPTEKGPYGMLALHSNNPEFEFSPIRRIWDSTGRLKIKEYVTVNF